MNDSPFHRSSSEGLSLEQSQAAEYVPQFGAVDIVEAFTAMRHEWRAQTKESRLLAEQIEIAAANLQALEEKLLAQASEGSEDNSDETKRLAMLIAETDHQLTRAIAAVEQSEHNRQLRETTDATVVERYFAGMSILGRWYSRGLLRLFHQQRQARESGEEHPAISGLNLVLARLRRMMKEHHIERIDAQGEPFDANTMHAIGTMDCPNYPSGHVAEQLSPCYQWHGYLLRFAEVRVAN